jgi:hypothetical protein
MEEWKDIAFYQHVLAREFTEDVGIERNDIAQQLSLERIAVHGDRKTERSACLP